jgi:AAA domain
MTDARRPSDEELRAGHEARRQLVKPKPNGQAGPSAVPTPDQLCLTPAQWSAREIPPEGRLLGALFSTTSRSQLSADTGLGKTMWGLAVAFSIRLKRNFLHWEAHRHARVLVVDGEMPAELIKARLAAAASWFGSDEPVPDGLFVLSREDVSEMPPLETEAGAQWLLEFIDKLGGVDFVIFDNIASLTVTPLKDEESAQQIKALQFELTKRRVGQLWLHHTGHDNTRGYGAKLREWWLDVVMVAEKAERSGADLSFTLKFSKCRRRTPENRADFEEVTVELRDGRWLSTAEPAPAGGKRKKLTKRAQLCLDALAKALADVGQKPPTCSATSGVARAVSIETWREFFNRMAPYTEDQADAKRKAWQVGLEELAACRAVEKWERWVWVSE